MVFSKDLVMLVNINTFVSKSGKQLVFLKIADPVTYDSLELFPHSSVDVSTLTIGAEYQANIFVDGRYTNLQLLPIK